jgi:hypothetical protein
MELTVTVRFRIVSGQSNIEPELEARNLPNRIRPQNPMYDDYYPFFSDTTVSNDKIKEINVTHQTVILCNKVELTIAEVRNEIDRLF